MSQKSSIGYVDLRVFAHVTEDSEKVLTAVRNLLTTALAEMIQFNKNSLTGHHGNSINFFTAQLTEKTLLLSLLEKLGRNINALDKEELNTNLKLHLEKTNLYLRFDKQAAFLGKTKLAQNDPIHLKIHFKNKAHNEILEILKKTEMLP
jgi:RNA binding exosome subunit